LVVPYPPGGFTDILGRLLSAQLQTRLGQTVIVDNKGGGGSTIGSALVARAPADGYTLLLVAPDLAINESLMASRLSYDARKDFSPVIRAAWSPMVLVTHPSVPAKTVSEFLALAKARPGKINFASGGIGTGAHLALELFKTRAGVDVTHVPYKGNGPATSDLLGGQVSAMFLQYAVAKPHIAGGKLVMLATPSGKRSAAIPDVPTIAESGLPGFDVEPWFGIVAPAGTPTAIVNRLNAEIGKIMQQNDVKEMLASVGAAPSISSPQEFGKFIDSEVTRWAEVVKASGAKAE
jgi:tripartite-type tricarboxylate transporter receptor subunit TctC